ncbi:MAG: CotH kinase family protein, partial [Fibrobacter sp.]|uniref:CotH kinase family protein n=1 Tax=Fibrobacter sp. TaxID=35828 RepID=UPI0025B8F037
MIKERIHIIVLMWLLGSFMGACSNSESINFVDEGRFLIEEGEILLSRWMTEDSLQRNLSSIYPYAGIPRVVIETEDLLEINDRETEIPAKMRIWGERYPETGLMEMTIRGRGNLSWSMHQKSYKLEFKNKQTLLGMPKDRDWALISNYADKSLMKNYLMYHLATKMGMPYVPRCEYVELYLNKEYLGVYLLTETIKKSQNRVNLRQDEMSYIVEIDAKFRDGEQVIFSDVISPGGKPFHIHEPQNASIESLDLLETFIQSFEKYLKGISFEKNNGLEQWVDIDEYIKHYWLQEFSKNPDANFYTSVYFSWTRNGVVNMGPIWDFDLSFGGHRNEVTSLPTGWHIKNSYWNNYIFRDSVLENSRIRFWQENKEKFLGLSADADSLYGFLE